MDLEDINYDFACRDDCLDKMVPSDLRLLISRISELERLNKSTALLVLENAEARVKLLSRLAESEAVAKSLALDLVDRDREIDRLKQEIATLKYTIVTTIGGVDYEGFPTSEINYLQRIRILLEKEQELANLEDSFQTIARENNELEQELATERENRAKNLKFLGAKIDTEGNMQIDMPKYHKAHCGQCEKVWKLREGLKKLEYRWNHQDDIMIANCCHSFIPCKVDECIWPKHKPDCWLIALLEETKGGGDE